MDVLDTEIRRIQTERNGKHDECETIQECDRPDSEYAVRRLTPTECAKLQGFPDDWCADVPHSDSAEYKMWGNGIALPCLLPMMKAMRDILKEEDKR